MRFYTRFLWGMLIVLGFGGCTKHEMKKDGNSTFGIVNVVAGGPAVTLNRAANDRVRNMEYKVFSSAAGDHIFVSAYPEGIPATLYFGTDLNASDGDLYTLLLSGSVATKVDAFFYREVHIPDFTDNIAGVRFINLVQNGDPISVNIVGAAIGSGVRSLAYQGIGEFVNYPALNDNTAYTFEIREAATGALLGSYVLHIPRFSSCTLVWKGMIGGSGDQAPGILRIDQSIVK